MSPACFCRTCQTHNELVVVGETLAMWPLACWPVPWMDEPCFSMTFYNPQ
jgi:hypothetical protein